LLLNKSIPDVPGRAPIRGPKPRPTPRGQWQRPGRSCRRRRDPL